VLVTIFLGASAFYFEHPPELTRDIRAILFYVLMALYVVAVVATIVCMVKSYTRYRYSLVPSPNRIGERVDELRSYYREYYGENDPAIEEEVKKDIQAELIDFCKQAGTDNRNNNLRRTTWLFFTTVCIVASLALLLLSRVVFYTIDNPPKPQKVRIVSTNSDPSVIQVEGLKPTDVQKVQIPGLPQTHRVEVTNQPTVQRVQITGQPPVQRVEVIEPKKESK
jgi:hypothetical protein